MKVSAKDKATGKEQAIRIEASSGLSKEEIDRMKAEAEANAEADKKEKERIDKLNQADSLIFSTENQLKDLGDKIPADKKAPIELLFRNRKTLTRAQDLAGIDAASAELRLHSRLQVLKCTLRQVVLRLVLTQVRQITMQVRVQARTMTMYRMLT